MFQLKSKTATLELTLSKKELFFSKDFRRALTIALAFHLFLFCLLRIERLNHLDPIAPPSPVSVTVEFHPSSSHSPLPLQLSTSPVDTAIFPELPPLPLQVHCERLDYDREILSLEPDFSEIEKIPYRHAP